MTMSQLLLVSGWMDFQFGAFAEMALVNADSICVMARLCRKIVAGVPAKGTE